MSRLPSPLRSNFNRERKKAPKGPAPHNWSLQLPSQNPQVPVTFVQSVTDSSFHSMLIPFAPKPAHKSASLLCSLKMCTAQSPILWLRSTPFSHYSISCTCLASIARYDIFCFALPLIQSTTVLLSHRAANPIPSTVLGGSITKGFSSLSFLRGMPPSIFLICNGDKWMANISVGIASVFFEDSFSTSVFNLPPILPICPEVYRSAFRTGTSSSKTA